MKIKYNTLNKKEVVSLNTEETLILRRYKHSKVDKDNPLRIDKNNIFKSIKIISTILFVRFILFIVFKTIRINYILYNSGVDVKIHIIFKNKKIRKAFEEMVEDDIRNLLQEKNPEVQNIEFI